METDHPGNSSARRPRRAEGLIGLSLFRASTLPLVCFIMLLAFACYAASVTGHWPYYAHPDPKELGLNQLVGVVAIGSLVGLVSVLLWPFIFAIAWAAGRWRQKPLVLRRGTMTLYFSGAALWVIDFTIMLNGGPWHSLLNWILD